VVLGFFSTVGYIDSSGRMGMDGGKRRMARPVLKPMSTLRFVQCLSSLVIGVDVLIVICFSGEHLEKPINSWVFCC
jgi:hypothetical protein